jgi:1-acyl-sn-glycerol-3-phosphate acyltransferase
VTTAVRPQAVFLRSPSRVPRAPRRVRAWLLILGAGGLLTGTAAGMLGVGVVTAFRARGLYRGIAARVSRLVLRVYGVRLRVHCPYQLSARQTVFVSNHTSTLDLFVLVALGLPACRFFLSGFLRKIVPLGVMSWMLGTFFTVPQDRPEERVRIFRRAAAVLRHTGESVYLSPEGMRVVTGEIGHFNKGAFHLATDLGAPVVPFYIRIPPDVDPGLGFDIRPGVVDVFFLPVIDTREWTVAAVDRQTASVRAVFVGAHEELSCRDLSEA